MATYPSYTQHVTCRAIEIGGVELDRAGNGAVRGRSFWTVTTYEFDIIHPVLLLAERDALRALYLANRLLNVDFYSDETRATHSCLFDGPPQFKPLGASQFRAVVKLVET